MSDYHDLIDLYDTLRIERFNRDQYFLNAMARLEARIEKLEEMKKHHDNEDWEKCGDVLGGCTFPRQRNLEFPEKGKIICNNHLEK